MIIIYKAIDLNKKMKQNHNYVLAQYGVTDNSFATLANFLQSVGYIDKMLIEYCLSIFFIYYKIAI